MAEISSGAIAGIVVASLILFGVLLGAILRRKAGRPGATSKAKVAGSRLLSDAPVVFPNYWESGGSNIPFQKAVPLESEVEVFQNLLDNTFNPKGATARRLLVRSVERMENSDLWTDYEQSVAWITAARRGEVIAFTESGKMCKVMGNEIKKPKLEEVESLKDPPRITEKLPEAYRERLREDINEAYLWHGTSRAAAASILKSDFRINLAGSAHGKKLGHGAYFAECSSLADAYAPGDAEGLHAMLLVRAALGKVHVTMERASMWSNKRKRAVSTHHLVMSGDCDSVLGDREKAAGTHREFCLADPHQLYPEYLVLYEREGERT